MNYLSVCSGIEAATVAWHPLGWKAVAYSEIEPFPSAVLAYHYPDVPNVGDMTKFKEWDFGSKTIDLLVGGTPCQSFSVAGLRKGLDDPRGNLALIYCGILDKFRPKWFVWENVPGVLSSNGGRDFGSFLGAVAELGYGFAYRVLDAQYYGVAQRRRRVFVVGHLGNWRSAAEVLFEPESLRRNNPPSRKQGEEVAGTITESFGISTGTNPNTIATLCATDANKWGSNQWVNEGKAILQSIALAENTIGRKPHNGGNGDGFTEGDPMYTLNATGVHCVAQPIPLNTMTMMGRPSDDGRMGSGIGKPGDPCPTITKAHSHAVAQPMFVDTYNATITGDVSATMTADMASPTHTGPKVMQSNMAVRRLTPLECERLQGFPNKYTNIPYRNKPESPDGPRYKALGNSMAVPVMHWIGGRIANVI